MRSSLPARCVLGEELSADSTHHFFSGLSDFPRSGRSLFTLGGAAVTAARWANELGGTTVSAAFCAMELGAVALRSENELGMRGAAAWEVELAGVAARCEVELFGGFWMAERSDVELKVSSSWESVLGTAGFT